jgi:hypothetical protein
MLEIESIEFHDDIFHAGKNFGKKIGYGTGRPVEGLKMEINEERTLVLIHYMGRTRELPTYGNAKGWELKRKDQKPEPKNEHKTESVEGRSRAQVSTPMGHVFEGPGKGKTKQ